MKRNEKDRPSARSLWAWVVLAFLILVSAWTVFIFIAVNNQPETVQLEQP